MDETNITVIIPALHEADRIVDLVGSLADISGVEVIVVDGDPAGSTATVLAGSPCKCLLSSPGRGLQMNDGAAEAAGDVLLFLHADSLLPMGWQNEVRAIIERGFTRCGAFSLQFDRAGASAGMMACFVGWWAGFRSRLDRRPYGDQSQFFDAVFFRKIGGYAEIPIMEDVEIMSRAVKAGFPPSILDSAVTTSARRYRLEGWLRRGMKNMRMRIRFVFGTDAAKLAGDYRPNGTVGDEE